MRYSFLMAVNADNKYLDAAIESVLNQSDPDFSFIVIANNCTNELWEKLVNYKDKRIILKRLKIGQLSYALNVGLDIIGDGYALRIDSDDICLENRLAETKNGIIRENYPDIFCGGALIINDENKIIGNVQGLTTHEKLTKKLWAKNSILHPTCALKVESIIKLRGYSGGFVTEDLDLWLRASRSNDIRFAGVSFPLIKYRIHSGQSRGNLLAYAESSGYALREALLRKSFMYFIGSIYRALKFFIKSYFNNRKSA